MPFHERASHPRPWATFVPRQPPSNSPLLPDGLRLQHDRGRPIEAPQLDAIRGIVNMSRPLRGLRVSVSVMLACDKRSNKNIGRDAMGRWFGMAAAAAVMLTERGLGLVQGHFRHKLVR